MWLVGAKEAELNHIHDLRCNIFHSVANEIDRALSTKQLTHH